MSFLGSYKMRMRRRRLLWRAFRSRHDLSCRQDNTAEIRDGDILCFCTVRNEKIRLPYFLAYYRSIGVKHFIFIDNGSTDGTETYLRQQPDVSFWHTTASYRKSRFGTDWSNWLLRKYGSGHWCLTVDADEFFVYPFCDTRPIRALTDWLQASEIRAFGSLILDMYPKGKIQDAVYKEGQNPFEIASWFDSGNYSYIKNPEYRNLWIQGGARARVFFSEEPKKAPALNKLPLVRWEKRFCYVSSTHMLLPRGLNIAYDEDGGEKTSGCLLHAKFLHTVVEKAEEERKRKEHYSSSVEYEAYRAKLAEQPEMWCKWSEKYINWRQLEILGLMSKGNWA